MLEILTETNLDYVSCWQKTGREERVQHLPLFNGVMRFRCLPSQPQLVLFYQWNETDLQEHKRRHLVTHMYNCICSGLAWPTFTFTRISKRKNGGHCMIWSSRRLQTFWWHIWSGLALLTTICGRTFCCHRKTVPRVQHFCKVSKYTNYFFRIKIRRCLILWIMIV